MDFHRSQHCEDDYKFFENQRDLYDWAARYWAVAAMFSLTTAFVVVISDNYKLWGVNAVGTLVFMTGGKWFSWRAARNELRRDRAKGSKTPNE